MKTTPLPAAARRSGTYDRKNNSSLISPRIHNTRAAHRQRIGHALLLLALLLRRGCGTALPARRQRQQLRQGGLQLRLQEGRVLLRQRRQVPPQDSQRCCGAAARRRRRGELLQKAAAAQSKGGGRAVCKEGRV